MAIDFSKIENLSSTYSLTKKLSEWNESKESPILGFLGARAVGVIATPFTCIIDLIAHAILTPVTLATGLVVTPYNFFAKKPLPEELQISAAFVHLRLVGWIVVDFFTLPFTMLLDPSEARKVLWHRQIKAEGLVDAGITALEKKLEETPSIAKEDIRKLQAELEEETKKRQEIEEKLAKARQEKEALEKQVQELRVATPDNAPLRQKIEDLKKELPAVVS